ncbi:hypothetical protein BJX96DRAFT_179301 [Aspergillus floccosus]
MYMRKPLTVLGGVLLGWASLTVASPSEERRSLPATLSMLTNTVKALGFLGEGGLQEVDLLVSHLLDLSEGKKAPVTSVEGAMGALSSLDILNDTVDRLGYNLELVTRGLLPSNIIDLLQGLTDDEINSFANNNPKSPNAPIYPQKAPEDAPYSVDFAKLLSATDFADPVWLNIPGNSLDDVQVNSEYVAYAINYLSGICNDSKIGVISWSQGGLDTQWAFKYWPSTRDVVQDFMPVSPDFHGSLIGGACPGFASPTCTPAVLQQAYDTNLIHTLRSHGGDSAYVPTTTLYSSLDEIVQPQIGTEASAYLQDIRAVGVTNNQVQLVCPGQIAGSIYTHESMLVNPVAWAMVVDALTHDGPGQASRIDLDTVCGQFLPPGLTIDDFLGVEATNVAAVLNVLNFASWTFEEPPIKQYAL